MIRCQCPACGATMSVPDAKAGRKGDCPKCGQRLQIPAASPARPSRAGGGAGWYCARDGDRSGPYDSAQLRRLAASGQVRPADMVRKEGMPDWAAAGSVEGLFPGLAPPPPPLPSPAPYPEKPVAGVLREAKGLLDALGDQIAAKAQDAAASARRAVEATGGASKRGRSVAEGARATPGESRPQRVWLWVAALFGLLCLLGLCAGVAVVMTKDHADGKGNKTASGKAGSPKQGGPDRAAISGTLEMTKDVFRQKVKDFEKGPAQWSGMNGSRAILTREEFYETFGKPVRTRTAGERFYWYWQCKDGTVRVEFVQVPIGEKVVLLEGIDDD